MVSNMNRKNNTGVIIKGDWTHGESRAGCDLDVLLNCLTDWQAGENGSTWRVTACQLRDDNSVLWLDIEFKRIGRTVHLRLAKRDDGTAVVERVWFTTNLPDE